MRSERSKVRCLLFLCVATASNVYMHGQRRALVAILAPQES
jgi:hypothetical protein